MTKKEILLKQRNAENAPLTDYIGTDGYVWKMIENAMEEYHQAKLKLLGIAGVSGRLSQQSEIVRQRLHYHFAKVGGGWNIEGMNAPFMKEFLNEVQKLVDLSK